MRKGPLIRKTCRRYNNAGHVHELTFSCFRNRPFLGKNRTRRYLAEAIANAREKHGFSLWAYVFMPNHVHMLIWPRGESYSISRILISIKQPASRNAIRYLRERNPRELSAVATGQKHSPYRFWQAGGGYDRNITSVEILKEMVTYIHRNPVRKGLVDAPTDWLWSSALDWSGAGQGLLPVDLESFPAGQSTLLGCLREPPLR